MNGNLFARLVYRGGAWLERHEKIVVPIAIFATVLVMGWVFLR